MHPKNPGNSWTIFNKNMQWTAEPVNFSSSDHHTVFYHYVGIN